MVRFIKGDIVVEAGKGVFFMFEHYYNYEFINCDCSVFATEKETPEIRIAFDSRNLWYATGRHVLTEVLYV